MTLLSRLRTIRYARSTRRQGAVYDGAPGPEQVDAYIDNDRPVHQQVTMWIRHGSEVIRGSTLLLPVRGDLLYLETIWVNSLQNSLPQLKLFAVRYQGRITSGPTLEEAIMRRESLEAPGRAVSN